MRAFWFSPPESFSLLPRPGAAQGFKGTRLGVIEGGQGNRNEGVLPSGL